MFLWTPPHFWALSLYRSDDYARAGVPMLPVVAGAARTKREIFLYSVVLTVIAALAPPLLGFATLAYGIIAAGLGAVFVWLAWQVWQMPESDTEMRPARRLFAWSMLYLFLLFAILLVENGPRRVDGMSEAVVDPNGSDAHLPPAEPKADGVRLTEAQLRRRRARSIAIAVALAVFVALFYAVTVAKLGANVLNRPL